MHLNLTVLCGDLAVTPELRVFDSGKRLVRFLMTVRQDWPRRRVDVIPATLWDPDDDLVDSLPEYGKGDRIWLTGSLQRRYWDSPDGRRSRVELVAEQVQLREADDA